MKSLIWKVYLLILSSGTMATSRCDFKNIKNNVNNICESFQIKDNKKAIMYIRLKRKPLQYFTAPKMKDAESELNRRYKPEIISNIDQMSDNSNQSHDFKVSMFRSGREETREEILQRFKMLYPIQMWKTCGWFEEDYLNIINIHWLKFSPPPRSAHIILGTIYIFIMIIGCSGNILVIFMFSKCHSLRTPANYLVVNLALSDLLMVSKTPIFIFNSFHFGPAMGRKVCSAYGFIGGLSGTVSIGTLAAIAFDRYCVVVYPLEPLRNINNLRAKLLALAVWVYGIFFAIVPSLDFGLGRYVPEGYLTSCSFDYLSEELNHKIFIFAFFCAAWLLPLSVIAYCYAKILRVVIATRNISDTVGVSVRDSREDAKRKVELKLAIIVICVIALFFVAWTPYAVVSLLGITGQKDLIEPSVSMFPALFCKTASCIDPFIYVITHPKFRKECEKLLCGKEEARRKSTYKSGFSASIAETNKVKPVQMKSKFERDFSTESDVEELQMQDVPFQRVDEAERLPTPKKTLRMAAPVQPSEPMLATISQRTHAKALASDPQFPTSMEKLNPPPPSWYTKPQFEKRNNSIKAAAAGSLKRLHRMTSNEQIK